jgi:hypothetical protein
MWKLMDVVTDRKVLLLLLMMLSFGFAGCSMVGKVVPADKQILLSETGNSGGEFKNGQCTVLYKYSVAGGNMNLAGSASYRGGYDSLNVRALFLDEAGAVLEVKLLYSSGYRVSRSHGADRSFQNDLPLPPGTAGISFSCSTQERSGNR